MSTDQKHKFIGQLVQLALDQRNHRSLTQRQQVLQLLNQGIQNTLDQRNQRTQTQ